MAIHVYLNRVDFPPILGPVTNKVLAGSISVLIWVELEIKCYLIHGWTISISLINGLHLIFPYSSISSMISGQQLFLLRLAAYASDYKQSNS